MQNGIAGKKNVGRFHIPAEWVLKYHRRVQLVMANCIVIRAEHLLATNEMEYIALSPYFTELQEKEVIPEYQWVFHEVTGLRVEKIR